MAIEQKTVIIACGNCDDWGKQTLCSQCFEAEALVFFDDNFNAYCQSCKAPWEDRENKYFDSRFLKLAIDKWFKQGWLLHETVINGVQAILTLRKSV